MGALDPWRESSLRLAPDDQVEFGDDLACVDQVWHASLDRRDRDGLRSRENVPPDCHEARDRSSRWNPLKILGVGPFSPASAGRLLANDAKRDAEAGISQQSY